METTLGYRKGFFGLIAEGWDIEDTTGKGARGALPGEAGEVEQIVGLFDAERSTGILWTLEEFSQFAVRPLTAEEIMGVRSARAALFRKWDETSPGQKLELTFPNT